MTHFPVIFVLGLAHSGTTLLGRVLDMHSRIICVGEMMRMADAMRKGFPCSCGKPIEVCDFWANYISLIDGTGHLDYKCFTQKLYEDIASAAGKDIVVDLSKTRVLRLMQGLFSGWRYKFKDAAFILLLRDPRGVTASAKRKTDKSLDVFLAKYLKWMKRFQKLADKKRERLLVVQYEDLCQDPEREIERICNFMGIDFEPGMLSPAGKIHHFVHSSTSNYMKDMNTLKIDERWRDELQPEEITQVETVISKVSVLKGAYLKPRSQSDGPIGHDNQSIHA